MIDRERALLRFRSGSFGYEFTADEVRVHLDGGAPTTFVLHLNGGLRPGALKGATLLHGYPEQGYYYFSGAGPIATIGLRPKQDRTHPPVTPPG